MGIAEFARSILGKNWSDDVRVEVKVHHTSAWWTTCEYDHTRAGYSRQCTLRRNLFEVCSHEAREHAQPDRTERVNSRQFAAEKRIYKLMKDGRSHPSVVSCFEQTIGVWLDRTRRYIPTEIWALADQIAGEA